MKTSLLLVLVVGCSGSLTQLDGREPAPEAPVWRGETRNVGGYWVFPSLFWEAEGKELKINVGIPVGTMDDLAATDISVDLRVAGKSLRCSESDSLGFIGSKGITAQAFFHCENPARDMPTELVVALKGAHESFALVGLVIDRG